MEQRGDYIEDYFTGDYRLNELLDGKLQTEDGYIFRIHKLKLAENNKYFCALFCGMEKDRNDFFIPGIRGKILSDILSYIYSGNIHITSENISELMIASDYLMVDGILTKLKIFMENNLSINNCIPFLGGAFTINREDFFKDSYRFVQTTFERVVHNESIETFDLPLEVYKQLLSDRNLCVSSEMTVFISIVKWVSFDSSERLALAPNLIQYLMVSAIDEDSATEILQHTIVVENTAFEYINNIKSLFSSSLQVIKYIQSSLQLVYLPIKRIPPKLVCVAVHDIQNYENPTQIYLTYDEQTDLWRKISVVHFYNTVFLFYIDDSIYMFDARNRHRNFRYSIVDREVHELSAFFTARSNYTVVDLEGYVYVLGGRSDEEGEIYSVEIYDSDLDIWHTTSSMIPISTFAAATLNNHIYVVGDRPTDEGREMIAQVFDASTQTWSLLPAVSTERSDFTMVSYLEKIYVIGGKRGDEYLKVVEVFDPAKNEWTIETSLPQAYIFATARVFQDLLIVFDDNWALPQPAVFYNNEKGRWEFFDESSPFKDAAHSFQFFTIDKEEYIDILTRENRQPDIHFEKSPFA